MNQFLLINQIPGISKFGGAVGGNNTAVISTPVKKQINIFESSENQESQNEEPEPAELASGDEYVCTNNNTIIIFLIIIIVIILLTIIFMSIKLINYGNRPINYPLDSMQPSYQPSYQPSAFSNLTNALP